MSLTVLSHIANANKKRLNRIFDGGGVGCGYFLQINCHKKNEASTTDRELYKEREKERLFRANYRMRG